MSCTTTTVIPPSLTAVPDGDFFCSACLSEGPKLLYSRAADIWDDKAVISYLKGKFQFLDLSGDDNISRVKKRARNYVYQPGVGLFKKAVWSEPKKVIPPKGDRTALIAKCHEECGHFGIKRVELKPVSSILSICLCVSNQRPVTIFKTQSLPKRRRNHVPMPAFLSLSETSARRPYKPLVF